MSFMGRAFCGGDGVLLAGISSPQENFVDANGSRADLGLFKPMQPTSHTNARQRISHLAPIFVGDAR